MTRRLCVTLRRSRSIATRQKRVRLRTQTHTALGARLLDARRHRHCSAAATCLTPRGACTMHAIRKETSMKQIIVAMLPALVLGIGIGGCASEASSQDPASSNPSGGDTRESTTLVASANADGIATWDLERVGER